MNVGIIGFQGDVQEHADILKRIGRTGKGINIINVKRRGDIDSIDHLIIPGGESTTIYKLIQEYGIYDAIIERARSGMPVMATCAGLIIISKNTGDERVKGMGIIDASIKRNAYGRQSDSFETELEIDGIGKFNGIFIRAPEIEDAGSSDVLSRFRGRPVMIRNKNVLGMTFHPELTDDTRIHDLFLSMGGEGYISTAKA
ncbi:MAG: pyridoxal 5'-phosphate synthase glutaminase subunit PdxT [Thermoplasmata archaeon]